MDNRHALSLDDDDPAFAKPPTRERIGAFLRARYSTRVHMSFILSACGLTAMAASWGLLHSGVSSMLVRYPISMGLAYATFLLGVWTWLRATGLADGRAGFPGRRMRERGQGGIDLDIPLPGGGGGGGGGSGGGLRIGAPRGGGGTFDGGGASASFQQQPVAAVQSSGSNGSSVGSKIGGSLLDGIDGDGIVLLILALLLVLVVFATSGYLIWCAPDVLTEAAFGAALTGTLSRASREHGSSGWVAGVVRKTWWPFALVLLAALLFAGWSATHYPEASTFREAIAAAIQS
jgi:hypothetical protein